MVRRSQVKPGQAAAGCSRFKASDPELWHIAAVTLFEISTLISGNFSHFCLRLSTLPQQKTKEGPRMKHPMKHE
jgi:hypothetical protein